ncbi:MAG TPA: 2-dehydropantoate 2-reductase [Rhizomicrobium sp.]|jgi:2-dehydropantoate 2-reductase|nr:2-dehydropantoate 2-reductase [Rhizomicrobium sp.]
MRIGIVGAGAIGGWIGVLLAQQSHELSVLARGNALESLRAAPWRLTFQGASLEAKVAASDSPALLGTQDILVIAVKGPALAGVAQIIRPMIGADTIVIPAMNGVPWWFLLAGAGSLAPTGLESVDPDGTIARAIPLASVIGCVVHASAHVSAPGAVIHHGGNKLILGAPGGGTSQRLQSLCELFSQAGFGIVQSPSIRHDIWYKLWGNMTMNPISAFTGATCDRILDDELVRDFVLRVMAEAAEIGKRVGCEIHERGENRIAVTRQLGAFKTSMLLDAEQGRPLEIDGIVAAPQEIGRLVGVPTPCLDTVLGLTRLYARNRGLY